MDTLDSTKRRGVSLPGAFTLLAAGVLAFSWFTHPIGAMQAGGAREAARMPDGTEFPLWERPLQFSRTYYVEGNSPSANDSNPGTKERPFRTIGKAADVLQPGERVVIAEGIYREVVRPQRGGTSPDKMISYEAAEGAKVIVRGSEIVKNGWRENSGLRGRGAGAQGAGGRAGGRGGQAQARTWNVDLPGEWFGGYNPFGMTNFPSQRWQYMNRMSINVHNVIVPYTRARGLLFVDGKPLDQVRATSEMFGRDPTWALGSRGQPYSAELFTEMGGGLGQVLHRRKWNVAAGTHAERRQPRPSSRRSDHKGAGLRAGARPRLHPRQGNHL